MEIVLLQHLTFNHEVIGDWNALFVVLDEATLVDQFAYGFQVRVTPCNVGLADTQHVDGGLVQLDEDTIVDLTQTEQLQNFTYFWGDLVDTGREKREFIIKKFMLLTFLNYFLFISYR